jgi:excinuclease ABC subunit A
MRLNGARQTPGALRDDQGLEHLDKVIDIDQRPIGRTPRSNPATYTGAFTPIRDWFAGLPEARRAATSPVASASTSRAGAARPARATGC